MQDEIKSDVPNTLRTDPGVEQLVRKITGQTWIFCHDGNGIEVLFADGTIVVEWDSINLVFEEVKQYGDRWVVKVQKVTNAFVSNISLVSQSASSRQRKTVAGRLSPQSGALSQRFSSRAESPATRTSYPGTFVFFVRTRKALFQKVNAADFL